MFFFTLDIFLVHYIIHSIYCVKVFKNTFYMFFYFYTFLQFTSIFFSKNTWVKDRK